MSQAVYTHFLSRLTRLFGEPKTDDVEAFLGEYVRELRHYSAVDLERGANVLIRRQTFHGWPTIAKCIDAIELLRVEPSAPVVRDDAPPPSPEAVARVRALVSDFKNEARGRQASIAAAADTLELAKPARELTSAERSARFAKYLQKREAEMFEFDRAAIRARMSEGSGA